MKIPTVKIQTDKGTVVINECDFDPQNHTLAYTKSTAKPKRRTTKKAAK